MVFAYRFSGDLVEWKMVRMGFYFENLEEIEKLRKMLSIQKPLDIVCVYKLSH